jgi:tRNA modification GTPase
MVQKRSPEASRSACLSVMQAARADTSADASLETSDVASVDTTIGTSIDTAIDTSVDPSVDTIVALATPPGVGGIGIIRLSGPTAARIAQDLVGPLGAPRLAAYRTFRGVDGQPIDHGIVLYFPAPASYTGEEVVELQGHGSPVALEQLIAAAVQSGARVARPGEFTERAFHNGRIDLAQAEAVMDLIHARTTAAARLAYHSLEGALSQALEPLRARLHALRVTMEADLDFGETDLDASLLQQVSERSAQLRADVLALQQRLAPVRAYTQGVRIVIAGAPNAGKSSLMNRLAAADIAIVTDRPGTTRDVLRATVAFFGLPVELMDTAGLHASEDLVEQLGMQRTQAALQAADMVLEIRDLTRPDVTVDLALPEGIPRLVVWNKRDLVTILPATGVAVSAWTGEGLEDLQKAVHTCLGVHAPEPQGFSVRTRHLEALARVAQCLAPIQPNLLPELVAEQLRSAMLAMDELFGRSDPEALLGAIFADFCIGK